MKIQCFSFEDAEAVAKLMKEAGNPKPAAVEIRFSDIAQTEFWAVSSPIMLDSLTGYVEQLRVVR